jgi:hypothetical protein
VGFNITDQLLSDIQHLSDNWRKKWEYNDHGHSVTTKDSNFTYIHNFSRYPIVCLPFKSKQLIVSYVLYN